MTCSTIQQHQARLYIEPGSSPYTFDTSSERWEFVTETLQAKGTLIQSQTTLGTRFKDVGQTRKGPTSVDGDIVFEPTKTWFDAWLPRILGAAESSDNFAVAETLPSFAAMVYRVNSTDTFLDGYANRLTLRATQGTSPVQATVNCMFLSSSTGSPPSVALTYSDAGDYPYVFTDSTVTLGGTAYQVTEWELVFDNMLQRRFHNSVNATSICPGTASVTLRVKLDPNSTSVISAIKSVAETGIAGVVALTNGIASTTFTFGKLVKPDSLHSINQASGPIDWDVTFEAKKDDTTPVVAVVNEDTA